MIVNDNGKYKIVIEWNLEDIENEIKNRFHFPFLKQKYLEDMLFALDKFSPEIDWMTVNEVVSNWFYENCVELPDETQMENWRYDKATEIMNLSCNAKDFPIDRFEELMEIAKKLD